LEDRNKICKYGYPFPAQEKDEIIGGRWRYRRGPNDGRVVPYCPFLMAVYPGNHCLIRGTDSDLTTYMTKYVTKNEDVVETSTKHDGDDNEVLSVLRNRITYSPQAIHHIMGAKTVKMSPMVVHVNLNLPGKQFRVLKD
jgi:hypothetical protein